MGKRGQWGGLTLSGRACVVVDLHEPPADIGFQGHFAAPAEHPDRHGCDCPQCSLWRLGRAFDRDASHAEALRIAEQEGRGSPAGAYPESLDKPRTCTRESGWQGTFDDVCPGYAVVGKCGACGKQYATELIDGKDWCQHCGGVDGLMHDRRKARWYPKAQKIASMGGFIITETMANRERLRGFDEVIDKDTGEHLGWKSRLSKRSIAYRCMFKRHGFDRGLSGWDWFGECHDPEHEAAKAETGGDCLCPRPWNPHFSALVDGGYLSPEKLEAIKRSVARIQGIPVGQVNVFYSYSDEPLKKLHMVHYVCRPTFLAWQWDEEMAVKLKGFRTYQAWGQGKWDGLDAWEVPNDRVEVPSEPVQALVKGFCPLDGAEIKWEKAVVSFALITVGRGWEHLGGGYHGWRGPPEQVRGRLEIVKHG